MRSRLVSNLIAILDKKKHNQTNMIVIIVLIQHREEISRVVISWSSFLPIVALVIAREQMERQTDHIALHAAVTLWCKSFVTITKSRASK